VAFLDLSQVNYHIYTNVFEHFSLFTSETSPFVLYTIVCVILQALQRYPVRADACRSSQIVQDLVIFRKAGRFGHMLPGSVNYGIVGRLARRLGINTGALRGNNQTPDG
jgi:hypothetical protein